MHVRLKIAMFNLLNKKRVRNEIKVVALISSLTPITLANLSESQIVFYKIIIHFHMSYINI